MIFEFSPRQSNNLPLEQVCQTIVETVGQVLKVDIAILCLNNIKEQYFVYHKSTIDNTVTSKIDWNALKKRINATEKVIVIENYLTNCQANCHDNLATDLIYEEAKITSSLSIPLLYQRHSQAISRSSHNQLQDSTGMLVLYYCGNAHTWESEEIKLATIMATQAALSIERVIAYDKLQALAQREGMVNKVTAAIRSSLEPEVIFAAITKELGQALKVDACILSLWTKQDRFVNCVGFYNPKEQNKTHLAIPLKSRKILNTSAVPISENPILQELLVTKKPIALADLETQQEIARHELPWHSKAKALLVVPLIVDNEIIGSITLRQSYSSRCWSESEIELVEALAAPAAIAVQQAKLYDTTKQQAEQLREREQKVKQLNNYLTESVLKRFLPDSIVDRAAVGELTLDLKPEPYLVTVLFADLVGFTTLSNYLEADTLAELLNEYLEAMAQAVFERRGTVDKFIGDGIMALFGAPEEISPQIQAQRAIATARSMQKYLQQINLSWQDKGILTNNSLPNGHLKVARLTHNPCPLQLRCGIHQGKAIVGMFGGKHRKDYTAIGQTVNIAARLEEAAEPGSILISAVVANWLNDTEVDRFRSIQLRGIKEELEVFSLIVSG